MRGAPVAWLLALLLTGCAGGTAQQELAYLRERVSTLEAENAHLRGQAGLLEYEREQLREQVNQLTAEAARLRAARAPDVSVAAGSNLVVLPAQAHAGQWMAVYVRNLPVRLLPQAGVAMQTRDGRNVQVVSNLSAANLFLLAIPKETAPGAYRIVLGERGVPPGARVDDAVEVTVLAP